MSKMMLNTLIIQTSVFFGQIKTRRDINMLQNISYTGKTKNTKKYKKQRQKQQQQKQKNLIVI